MQNICEKSSEILNVLVDDFLIYYCAQKEGLDKKFARKLREYRDIIQKMPDQWAQWLLSQYIAHRLFYSNGLMRKYLNHPELKQRSPEKLAYLKFQIEHPWRFSFCSIEQNPAEHFFDMKDVISGEEFLLYSPGVSQTQRKIGSVPLFFFFLIGFNGKCWQTYGPQAYFKGLQPFDLLFFAKQLVPSLNSMHQIPDLIEINPLPFMMLWAGGELPPTFHKNDQVILNSSEYYPEDFNPDNCSKDFIIEKKHPVYMLSLKRWHKFPHLSKCFYNMKKKRLILTSMTDRGYDKLVEALNRLGFKLPLEPENRVTPAMLSIIKDVLRRDVVINPYEKIFTRETSLSDQRQLAKINTFLESLMEALNSGRDYDIRELAKLSDIEHETAKQIAEQVIEKLGRDL